MQQAFTQIGPHVHWLAPDSTTDRPVLGVITGQRGTLAVDAGNSPAHAQLLLREVANAGLAPPSFVALTHWHWDHVFGTATLDLPTFSHRETQRVVAEMARLDWSDAALDRRVETGAEIAFCRDMIKAELPDRAHLTLRVPEIAFDDHVTMDLGGVTCQIVHVGGDHAADSTIVYVPEDRIVFLGDCFYVDIYSPQRRYTTARLFPLIDRLLGFDAECYLAGHDPEPISRAQMIEDAALLTTIGRTVDQHRHDRAAILADLEHEFGGALDEDQLEYVDAFLAGLSDSTG